METLENKALRRICRIDLTLSGIMKNARTTGD
jgi:hypothetical protein